jgi:RNA polymerase sigma-70 factor (ECF subfamily)
LSGPADEVVVRACQQGDRDAFAVLVEKHRTMLFGTAYLMTRDRQLAEDAVQEALIKMWKHIGSLRQPAGLRAWLARIVLNEVRQQARRRQTPVVLEEIPDPPASDKSAAGSGGEVRQDLERAVGMLPPEQKEAVILRFFSDLTVPEVAAATRSREGTVKSRLSRAMDRLSKLLPGYGNGEGRA